MGVHVLLLPWEAQGHITPMTQLARILASQQGFFVTLVLGARAKARQGASSHLPLQPNIRIEVIRDGFNPDASHNPSLHELMMSSSPIVMQHSLDNLLQALMASPSPVSCLISDTFCFWSQPLARKFGIPRAELWCSPAYAYCSALFQHLSHSQGLIPLKGQREDTWISCIPGIPPVQASDLSRALYPSDEDVQADPEMLPTLLNRLKEIFGNAKDQCRLLVNNIYELESEAFDALCGAQVQACAIGPLFLHNLSINEVDRSFQQPRSGKDHACLQWLDCQGPASTLYVALGGDTRMEKQDMEELAYGLEASGHSFLWVIRGDVLPEGYKERVGERGLVVSWAPQADVLAHFAIGGFLSHCGWSSILESLWSGVPILAWPQSADQGLNKRFIEEEWKVGIAVEKNEKGKVSRICIEKAVRSIMQGDIASHVWDKVKDVKDLMLKAIQDGGSSRRNVDEFIQDLCSMPGAQNNK